MRILLFGEFSGLFNCLKEGLVALGHEVYLVSDGNGFKNYPSDFRYDIKIPQCLRKLSTPLNFLNLWLHKKRLRGFDVVFFVDPSFVSRHTKWNAPLYRYMIKHNKTSYLCGSGDTALMVHYWINSKEKYKCYVQGIINGAKKNNYSVLLYPNKKLEKWENELLHIIDGYIPIWYEYAQPFRQYKCIKKTIRIPIPIQKYKYTPNIVKDKIVFFHGVPTREEAKGTPIIREAFRIMEKKYGDEAEFICAGGLPFDEYMQLISRVNVILDDANSYSIAMNGLLSMAKGKIVMGGAESEGNKELGIDGVNPVFNLTRDVIQICNQIEYIILHKDKIEEWGRSSRIFVEKYHDSEMIAQQYINVFQKGLDCKNCNQLFL